MKNISLFQGILIGVFVIGGFIGLFVFSTYSSGGGKASLGPVTIWGILPKNDMASVLADLGSSDESFKGVKYVEHDAASLATDLATAIATGGAPDLLLISQEQILSLRTLIQPVPDASLPARTFSSSFVSEAQLFRTAAGSYGVPFLIDPLVLFYNRATLFSNGIAAPPTTWEALTGLVSKVRTLSPDGRITRALAALGSYDNVHNARGILSALFLQTQVPITVMTGDSVARASLGVQAVQGSGAPGEAVLRFYTQFADPTKVSYTWDSSQPDSQQAFLLGDLALYLGYASEAKFLSEANPNLDFDVAALPQPSTSVNKTTYGLVYGFTIPKGARNAAGALKVALALAQSTRQTSASATTGLAPASISAIGAGTTDTILSVAYKSALYAKGWLSPGTRDTDRVFSGMIQDVTSGKSDLRSALSTAERSLNGFLQ